MAQTWGDDAFGIETGDMKSMRHSVGADSGPLSMIGLAVETGDVLRTVPEQIADQLARDIVAGVFRADQKLSEPKLAARFGVSRGPIRDALDLLERNAFVRVLPRRSARVNLLTKDQIEQLFEIRASLMGLIARYAARHAQPHEIESLRSDLESLSRIQRRRPMDVPGFYAQTRNMWIKVDRMARARRVTHVTVQVVGSALWQNALKDKLTTAVAGLPGARYVRLWEQIIGGLAARDEQMTEKAAGEVIRLTWSLVARGFDGKVEQSTAGRVPAPRAGRRAVRS